MANIKISQLPAASAITPGTDAIPIVHSGATEKATPNQVVNEVLKAPGPIGGTSPAAGSFTTLNASGASTINGTTIPASTTLADTDNAQTLLQKTFAYPRVWDPDRTNYYRITPVGNLSLDVYTYLPILTGNDYFVFRNFPETLTNKTINLSNNTLSGTLAEFNSACSDADFVTTSGSATLSDKTISLSNNTLSGTLAQFNAACIDADFASVATSQTLTNKTLNLSSNTLTGTLAQFNAACSNTDFITGVNFFDVIAYGADSTGVGNSTTAFQNAINAAAAVGGTVGIPAGSYRLNTLTIAPNVTIRGAGRRSTNLVAAANSTAIFSYTGNGVGFNINNLSISGGGFTSVSGILINGTSSSIRASNIYISDIDIIECNAGIYFNYVANVKVNNVWIALSANGVTTDLCADVDLTNITVQSGSGYGFHIIGDGDGDTHFDEGIRLIGCSTNGQEYGLYVTGHDWGCVTGCSFTTDYSGSLIMIGANNWKFSSCEFASAAPGDTAASANIASSANITFAACQFYLGSFGVNIDSGSKITISGCSFQSNAYQDILIGSGSAATYCVINGNTFSSNTNSSGIYEYVGSNYNVITNNTIKKNGGVGLTVAGANTLYQIGTTPLNVIY